MNLSKLNFIIHRLVADSVKMLCFKLVAIKGCCRRFWRYCKSLQVETLIYFLLLELFNLGNICKSLQLDTLLAVRVKFLIIWAILHNIAQYCTILHNIAQVCNFIDLLCNGSQRYCYEARLQSWKAVVMKIFAVFIISLAILHKSATSEALAGGNVLYFRLATSDIFHWATRHIFLLGNLAHFFIGQPRTLPFFSVATLDLKLFS